MVSKQTAVPDSEGTPEAGAVFMVFGTIVDTTWRLFVPVIVGGLLGLWFDITHNTKPWWLLAGTVIGAFVAILLVWQQYQRVKKEDHRV